MRVKISYGMEVEDVPIKATEIGNDALEVLQKAVRSLERAIMTIEDSDEYSMVLSMLEKARLELTKTDQIIKDLAAILNGLDNYHNGEHNVSDRRPIVDSSGNTTEKTEDSRKG